MMNNENNENTYDINKYQKIIKNDTIFLLTISIIFLIISVWLISNKEDDESVIIFLKSIIFILFAATTLLNIKKKKIRISGTISLINGILMIISLLVDKSFFGIVYFFLGAFYSVHSIIYLKKSKNIDYAKDNKEKIPNIKYLTIIPNLLFLILFLDLGYKNELLIEFFVLFINIVNLVFIVILNKKYNSSSLIYITMIASIFIVFFLSIFLIEEIGSDIIKKNRYDSEEYFIESCNEIENKINSEVTYLENLTSLNVIIGNNQIIYLEDYLSKQSNGIYDLNRLIKEGYNCDGYIVLDWKDNLEVNNYYEIPKIMEYPFDMKEYFDSVNTYISCQGKYKYKTKGFSANNLK